MEDQFLQNYFQKKARTMCHTSHGLSSFYHLNPVMWLASTPTEQHWEGSINKRKNTEISIWSHGLKSCLYYSPALCLEKAMAPNSSTLAWKIPWTEEPGRLQSMGLLRVRHDWATSLSVFTFMHWRRKWQPTPVFLPGESQGRGSLVGCRLWGCTESGTTEVT